MNLKKYVLISMASLMFVSCAGQSDTETEVEEVDKAAAIAQRDIGVSGQYQTKGLKYDDTLTPTEFLTTWNFNNLEEEERANFYQETPLDDGTLLREYWFDVEEVEIEVAPGVFYPAWSYNGQVPGPTIRATEGDTLKINLSNFSSKPHTAHFHGFHSADMDGSGTDPRDKLLLPGEVFTYHFKAEPFGSHVYHCHSYPVSEHISRGLYGAYIVDPKEDTRPKADYEFVMVMNAFDTNFDGGNEVYAVNTRAFAYKMAPIKVKAGELVRVYLSNMVELDPINSFHLHANFFDEYPTGTKLVPTNYTDTFSLGAAERSTLDIRFREEGKYMFHSHISEFSELGWMGAFDVIE
jgi:manganese oxidase